MAIENKSAEEKHKRARKMMLYFGIISLTMTFAGLLSAFIVSSSRPDWADNFIIPTQFTISTIVILASSLLVIFAKKNIITDNKNAATSALVMAFFLGIIFIILQFLGFQEITNQGYYFTGNASNVTASYIYLIAFLHIVHIFSGIIVLSVVIYNHFKKRYSKDQMLGFELGATFWHFVDVLWLLLFFFFLYFLG